MNHRTNSVAWRDRMKVHRAADLFPMMSEAELRALGDDIRKNELKQPITVYAPHRRPDALRHGVQAITLAGEVENKKQLGELELLDGRNRLSAMQLVGLLDDVHFGEVLKRAKIHWLDEGSPEEFVTSANIHRRHLTAEQKRDLIAALLKAKPERSDRATAKIVHVDNKTVASVRAELSSTEEIPQLERRVGADGKARQQPQSTKTSPVIVDAGAPGDGLAVKLEPLLEDLFIEGQKNMATMSPGTVAHLVCKLERVLVEAGIVPPSRRSTNPISYARSLKAKETYAWNKACRERQPPHKDDAGGA